MRSGSGADEDATSKQCPRTPDPCPLAPAPCLPALPLTSVTAKAGGADVMRCVRSKSLPGGGGGHTGPRPTAAQAAHSSCREGPKPSACAAGRAGREPGGQVGGYGGRRVEKEAEEWAGGEQLNGGRRNARALWMPILPICRHLSPTRHAALASYTQPVPLHLPALPVPIHPPLPHPPTHTHLPSPYAAAPPPSSPHPSRCVLFNLALE